jgi:catechol 2,3-dioxygenase-like lactoylglutathione lyase family enzyme
VHDGSAVGFELAAIDHVQLSMPPGEEERGRAFYGGVLGMTEMPKPPVLAARGGAWFASGSVQLHLGVEADFRPAKKAHPAVRVEGIDALAALIESRGVTVRWDDELPGYKRFYVDDPWGNRLELLEPENDGRPRQP